MKTGLTLRSVPEYRTHSVLLHVPTAGEVAFQPQELGVIETIARTKKIQPLGSLGIRPVQTKRFFIGTEIGMLYH